jgi:hypothetical protein
VGVDVLDGNFGDLRVVWRTRFMMISIRHSPSATVPPKKGVGADDAEASLPIVTESEGPCHSAKHLRSLAAHYYRFLPDPRGSLLTLDFSGLAPAGDLDIDACVKISGRGWERLRPMTSPDATLRLSDPKRRGGALSRAELSQLRSLFLRGGRVQRSGPRQAVRRGDIVAVCSWQYEPYND